ncbi:hypothetical protein P8H27_04605 [Pseudomonas sp. sp1636]|uniref:hypothetical protein n=1 Tax=Pseudomonas sp. sp1636 TaxID=3036707 RepID=UPI0025A62290|nr:hypothetical protein [Pseudomonas sp. sp1636]MDM8348174.1 hypothetical protein [Pseudomonas sp. sp1636]
MRADYGARDDVRRLRRLGWSLSAPILLGVLLALAWKIAEVSERRALEATREHLVASLNGLVAEGVARGQGPGAGAGLADEQPVRAATLAAGQLLRRTGRGRTGAARLLVLAAGAGLGVVPGPVRQRMDR